MSGEVYFVILVIGILTFYNLTWILKKFIKSDRQRNWMIWLGTIILTPLIYLGLIAVFMYILWYEPTRDFDKEKWFANKDKRYEMMDNIIVSGILKSKDKNQIVYLIGKPDFRSDSTNIWNYDLVSSRAGLGWQFHTLLITFDNDQVVKIEKRKIVD